MTNRKAIRRARRIRRTVLTVCLMALVAVLSIGGTIAWLTDKTNTITNTFTASGIEITLTETANQSDGTWKAQLIPGKEYAKNPVVTVDGDKTNVDVYLFVKFDEKAPENKTTSQYINYTSNLTDTNGWTKVSGTTNVWWREVKTSDSVKSWNLLDGDKVTIVSTLTDAETDDEGIALEYTAYAIQKDNLTNAAGTAITTADEAWSLITE